MVAVIGHLTVDDIVLPDGRTASATPGGNAVYTALGARLWPVQVVVITCRGSDYPEAAWARLTALPDVDWTRAIATSTPSRRQWALYDARGGRRYRARGDAPGYGDISPRPQLFAQGDWSRIDAVHIAPMPLAVVAEWVSCLRRLRQPLYIQVDPHHDEIRGHGPDWAEILTQVDTFLPSELEARQLAREGLNAEALLALLSRHRPGTLILKNGEAGSTARQGDRVIHAPAVPVEAVDPTGCGDAYAGGVLAAVAQGRALSVQVAWGAVSASFALEGYGPTRLWSAGPPEARARWLHTFSVAEGGRP